MVDIVHEKMQDEKKRYQKFQESKNKLNSNKNEISKSGKSKETIVKERRKEYSDQTLNVLKGDKRFLESIEKKYCLNRKSDLSPFVEIQKH